MCWLSLMDLLVYCLQKCNVEYFRKGQLCSQPDSWIDGLYPMEKEMIDSVLVPTAGLV